MTNKDIRIGRYSSEPIFRNSRDHYTLLWIRDSEKDLMADHITFEKVKNILFFLHPHHSWRLLNHREEIDEDYIILLSEAVLNEPAFDRLELTRLRILYSHHIHQAPVSTIIGRKLEALLGMLTEFIAEGYPPHRKEAIISLIHIFFVFCDDHWKSPGSQKPHNQQTELVYRLLRLLRIHITEMQKVSDFAKKLQVTPGYLSECTQAVLGISTKTLIIHHLLIRGRHLLYHTDKSIKEIAYELGFSSPEYFSSFWKKHTGDSPTHYRRKTLPEK